MSQLRSFTANLQPPSLLSPLDIVPCVCRPAAEALAAALGWSGESGGEGLRLQSMKAHFTNQLLYLPPATRFPTYWHVSHAGANAGLVRKPGYTLVGGGVGDYFGSVEHPVVSEYSSFLPGTGRACLVVHKVDFVRA